MLQCNRYPGLDANEIIRLTSAIGQEPPVGSILQFSGSFAVLSRKQPLDRRHPIFSPDWLQCSGSRQSQGMTSVYLRRNAIHETYLSEGQLLSP